MTPFKSQGLLNTMLTIHHNECDVWLTPLTVPGKPVSVSQEHVIHPSHKRQIPSISDMYYRQIDRFHLYILCWLGPTCLDQREDFWICQASVRFQLLRTDRWSDLSPHQSKDLSRSSWVRLIHNTLEELRDYSFMGVCPVVTFCSQMSQSQKLIYERWHNFLPRYLHR